MEDRRIIENAKSRFEEKEEKVRQWVYIILWKVIGLLIFLCLIIVLWNTIKYFLGW